MATRLFVALECSECSAHFRPTSGGFACSNPECDNIVITRDLSLDYGEEILVKDDVVGYTHRADCADCAGADPQASHGYSPARHVDIVFMQGDEGREVVDRIMRTDGVVMHGPTDETIAEAVAYLSEWDYGDDDNIRDNTGAGVWDTVVTHGDYVLIFNAGLGYVGLVRPLS